MCNATTPCYTQRMGVEMRHAGAARSKHRHAESAGTNRAKPSLNWQILLCVGAPFVLAVRAAIPSVCSVRPRCQQCCCLAHGLLLARATDATEQPRTSSEFVKLSTMAALSARCLRSGDAFPAFISHRHSRNQGHPTPPRFTKHGRKREGDV